MIGLLLAAVINLIAQVVFSREHLNIPDMILELAENNPQALRMIIRYKTIFTNRSDFFLIFHCVVSLNNMIVTKIWVNLSSREHLNIPDTILELVENHPQALCMIIRYEDHIN